MFMEGDLRTKNLAIAHQAEIEAEKQRVESGIIKAPRFGLIRQMFKGAGMALSPEAAKRKAIQMGRDIR